jgi:hypothetical protein
LFCNSTLTTVYSKDLAKLFYWTLHEYDSPDPIILSVDESDEITIKDVVNEIAAAMEFKGEIVWDSTKSDGQYKKTVRCVLPESVVLRRVTPFFLPLLSSCVHTSHISRFHSRFFPHPRHRTRSCAN